MGLSVMTFFEDPTMHTYSGTPKAGVQNVGWLGEGEPFQTGATSEAFQAALNELCNNSSINQYRGHHVCEFCPADPALLRREGETRQAQTLCLHACNYPQNLFSI